MSRRIGFVGVLIEDRNQAGHLVNKVLAENVDLILARVGLPGHGGKVSVVTLVVEATTDELGRLTGQLGQISGVSVKSGLAKGSGIGQLVANPLATVKKTRSSSS
ncbi:MAG: CopG family transcriptional regulator [Lentisphaerae bacterium]|nr:CopG family transcriptional regulator [Lentisphaerota bacterium]